VSPLLGAEEEDDAAARGAALLRAMTREAADALAPHLGCVLPAAFLAKHAAGAAATPWAEVWESNTGAERAALRLYGDDIAKLVVQSLGAGAWAKKQAAAAAAAAMAKGLSSAIASADGKPAQVLGAAAASEEPALAAALPSLAAALLAALPGRLWEGKEAVFAALGSLAEASPTASSPFSQQMLSACLAALARKKPAFRTAALECLASLLRSGALCAPAAGAEPLLPDEAWTAIAAVLLPAAAAPPAPAVIGTPVADDDAPPPPPPAAESLRCLAAAWPRLAQHSVDAHSAAFCAALVAALKLDREWGVRAQALAAAAALAARPPSAGGLDALGAGLVDNLGDAKAASVRSAAAELLGSLLAAAPGAADAGVWLAALRQAEQADVNSGVRGAAGRAIAKATAMEG
jgi:hypothetical protein